MPVPKTKRIIPLKEVAKSKYYKDMAILSSIFGRPIVEDESGTWRWQLNRLADEILGQPYKIDLNDLSTKWHEGRFSVEEYMKWHMDIGYSLCGFSEIFDSDLIERVIKNHSKNKNKGKPWLLAALCPLARPSWTPSFLLD